MQWWRNLKQRWLDWPLADFGPGILDECFSEPPPIASSFKQTGALPHSSSAGGLFCRFQSKEWLYRNDKFHRNFDDSPRKWNAQDRYAGAGVNYGHFFGCSVAASTFEAQSYKMDMHKHSLLELEMTVPSMLDLTYEENIDWILRRVFENPELVGRSYFSKLIELIHHQKGGDKVNEMIGAIAATEGFDGIIFYGARALRKHATAWQTNPEDPLIDMIEQMTFPAMREDQDLQNIVVFSGSLVTRAAARYRIDGGAWQPNPYYGISEEQFDQISPCPSTTRHSTNWIITKKIRLQEATRDHPGDDVRFTDD
jgi:hypothetical protein